MLNKIRIIKLKKVSNPAGDIIKYVDRNKFFFKGFGEIYFNEIKKGYQKGWNLHKKCTCLITVSFGSVNFTIRGKYKKSLKQITIKRKDPKLLIIPPNYWFKFRSNTKFSMIINLINEPHNKNETLKSQI